MTHGSVIYSGQVQQDDGPDIEIRLDDDVYVAANRESKLITLEVRITRLQMQLLKEYSGQIAFLRDELPPDNLDTYRRRGDMSLLDRLSYGNSVEIPRNWAMISLDPARIEPRS